MDIVHKTIAKSSFYPRSRPSPRNLSEDKKKKKNSEDSNDDGQQDGKRSSRKKDGLREKTFEKKEKYPDGEK
jgi:hypothetical protein